MRCWLLLLLAACFCFPPQGRAGETEGLGIKAGRLRPCPESPNCVSSQSPDEKHFAPPLLHEGDRAGALSRLAGIVTSLERAKVVEIGEDYLRAEFTSRVFRFVDDVEFRFDSDGRTIHFRSASRVGWSDLGVNRKRVEAIRKKWNEK
ncbi:MAG: DUF1499 domain-containing protein [Pseudomonadota bacterium]